MRARLIFIVVLAAAGCNSPAAPEPAQLTKRIETAHFVFLMSANDAVDTAWQEAYHAWAVNALQVTVTKPITYNKYLSRTHMGAVIGVSNTNAFADPDTSRMEMHTIWPTDNHEVVHLYSSAFGMTVSLFSEGLAVAYQVNAPAGETTPKWSGVALDELARTFRQQGRLPSIVSIADNAAFRAIDPNVAYPVSGSFVRYLIDTYGLASIKQLYGATRPTDSGDRVAAVFATVYGRSLADAERDWQARLTSPGNPPAANRP
jgi:hypothetical protein